MTTTIALPVRQRSYDLEVSRILVAAFTLSAGYTVYTTVAGLTPEGFNATNPGTWVFYAVGFGAAALARSDRRWSWWSITVLQLLLLAVGLFVYPATFTHKLQTPIGWFENDIYMGLLLVSLYLSVQRLREMVIAPRS